MEQINAELSGREQKGSGGGAWDLLLFNMYLTLTLKAFVIFSAFIQSPWLGASISVYFLERGQAAHLIIPSFLQLSGSREPSAMWARNILDPLPEGQARLCILTPSSPLLSFPRPLSGFFIPAPKSL